MSNVPFKHANPGGRARKDDPRDYRIGEATASTCPAVFMQPLAFSAPIYFQGKRPACGAHAGAWMKTFLDIRGGNGGAYYTPRFTWIDMKKDGSSPSDGVSMDQIFSSLHGTGVDVFEPLENDVTWDDKGYAEAKYATPSMYAAAASNKLDVYAYFSPTFQQIKQKIYDDGAVLLLIRLGDEFYTAPNGQTSWAEKDILPLRPPSTIISGHFVVAHSYDEGYIYFANSFGTTWGRNGHGYFGINYMPYIVEAGIGIDPQSPTAPSIITPAVSAQIQATVTQIQALPVQQQASWLERLIAILQSFTVKRG